MNLFAFIVGSARSVTTLLRQIVDVHPLIALLRKQHWLPKWFERRKGVTPEGFATPELISELIKYEKFARMNISCEQLERLLTSDEPVKYSDFVTGVFGLYGQAQGKLLVGDKTPAYVDRMPTLHVLWPGAKFVHIIRDGRDVCLSILDWKKRDRTPGHYATWEDDPVSIAALWWERKVRLGREAGASLDPGLYHEARYESPVARPAEECEALCGFLGVPFDGTMLRFHEGRERAKPGLDAKKAWRPVTSDLRDCRSQMPAGDVERFEAVVGDLLDELGYASAVPRPSSETLKHAQKFRHSFRQDLRDRGDRLLERWRV